MKFLRRRTSDGQSDVRVLTKLRGWRKPKVKPVRPLSLSTFSGMGFGEQVAVVAVTTASLLLVMGVGMTISYSHMFDWAVSNSEPEWRAKLFPLSVDGSMIVASMIIYVDTRANRRRDWMAYGMVGLGAGWSVLANVAHDWINPVAAKLIAGWPAFALFSIVELSRRFAQRVRTQADERRHAEAKAARRVPPTSALPTQPFVVESVEKDEKTVSEPLKLDAAQVEKAEFEWLQSGMNARTAMFAYLDQHSKASGAELDRLVGARLGASEGYGRKMRVAWLKEQEEKG